MTPSRASRDSRRVRDLAAETFGHDRLLPGQEEAVKAVLDGRDVLMVSPTGSGKSLTYQLSGVLLKGCTLVVSPLLALQRDQIDSLEDVGPRVRGARLSSAETEAQRREALDLARAGEVEFLFCSPEQLANEEVRAELAALKPSLVAVDEAHCVSAWGHDFRPDYFRMGELIDEIGRPRVIALTATAAPPVRDDIVARLRLQRHRLVVTGFERENLRLTVRRFQSAREQLEAATGLVTGTEGSGIVYCRTRRSTEEYAAALDEAGVAVRVYHAGLSRKRRAAAHEAFMDGDARVIVATSAFGMGIDKPDIRFVVHAQVPESPDTYYQEVGRAGRDGEPAEGTLLYRSEDLSLGRFFSGGVPNKGDVKQVVDAVGDQPSDGLDRDALREQTGLGPRRLGRILNLVDEVRQARDDVDLTSRSAVAGAAVEQAEAHRNLERSRVEMMRGYAETERCRAEFLLGYFGEELTEPCDNCDNCAAGTAQESSSVRNRRYPLQAQVRHQEFGEGTVMEVEEDRITVLFTEVGYRTLGIDIIEDQELLERC